MRNTATRSLGMFAQSRNSPPAVIARFCGPLPRLGSTPTSVSRPSSPIAYAAMLSWPARGQSTSKREPTRIAPNDRCRTCGTGHLHVEIVQIDGFQLSYSSGPEPPCKPNRPKSADSLRVSGPKPGSRGQPTRPRALFANLRAQQRRRLLGATFDVAQR